jgi:Ca2+-binding EF-hand superfamily protein
MEIDGQAVILSITQIDGGNKMKTFKVTMFLAVAMAVIGCATMDEQPASRDYAKLCTAMDKNCDGVIDKEEFLFGAKDPHEAYQVFLQCDRNKDGVIDKEEAQQAQKLMQREMLKREALRLVEPR